MKPLRRILLLIFVPIFFILMVLCVFIDTFTVGLIAYIFSGDWNTSYKSITKLFNKTLSYIDPDIS